jgi:hypothetical protein
MTAGIGLWRIWVWSCEGGAPYRQLIRALRMPAAMPPEIAFAAILAGV